MLGGVWGGGRGGEVDGGGGELGCEGDIFFYLNTVLALGVWGRGGVKITKPSSGGENSTLI